MQNQIQVCGTKNIKRPFLGPRAVTGFISILSSQQENLNGPHYNVYRPLSTISMKLVNSISKKKQPRRNRIFFSAFSVQVVMHEVNLRERRDERKAWGSSALDSIWMTK